MSCILTDRTKERLLPLVKKYILNKYRLEENNENKSIRIGVL